MSEVLPTICVDFDGTITSFAYPGVGEPKPGVRQALMTFKRLGFHIIIFSCRTSKYYPDIFNTENEVLDMNRKVVRDMIEYLRVHDIPYDAIDDGTMGKPLADYYIDDKGIRFDNNWASIEHAIMLNTKFGVPFKSNLNWGE